jgi:Bacterial TniB protein
VGDSTAHLDEVVRADLLLPDAQRIARIDRDRWIGYGRAREILAELERILRSERRQRPDNLLIIGASDQTT